MTDQATGALSKIVIGFEASAYGTAAVDGFDVPFVSSSLKLDRNKQTSPIIRGDFNPVKPTPGNKVVSGTIVVPFDSIASYYWLKAAFNTVDTTGTSSPYTHSFTMEGTTKRKSLTIEHQYLDLDTPQYFMYTGCKISRMSFSTGGEGELLLNLDVVGSDREIDTSSFDAEPTEVGYEPLNQSQAALKEGNTTYADATNVTYEINFNPDTSQYVIGGGGALGAIPDGVIAVTGNLSALFTDVALLSKAAADTETSLEVTYTGSSSSKVIADFPELQFSESDPPIEGPQGIVVSLPWSAYYDDGSDESAVVIQLVNTEEHE
jgi:hypothetical protein